MIQRALIGGLLLFLAGCGVGAQENVLTNPGFESGAREPQAWSFNRRGTRSEITWDTERTASGRRSVKMVNQAGQSGNILQTVRFDPPLPTGSVVEYGAMSATQGVTGESPRIVLYLQPPTGDRQNAGTPGSPGTHDFAPVSGTATTSRPVASIVIYLTHYGNGTAWWDDAYLRIDRAEPVTTVARQATSGGRFPLRTGDGLTLTLDDAGGLAEVRVGTQNVRRGDLPSGIWVQPWRGRRLPVAGSLSTSGGRVQQSSQSGMDGLSVDCRWTAQADLIRCDGAVTDRSGQERGVELIVSLPVGDGRWRWWQNILEDMPLAAANLDDLTFSAITSADAGLSLAVPADSPADCHFGWSEELGYHLRFRFGLSALASGELKSSAPFSFTISRVDPRWGLRDAALRYQKANPAAFVKRAKHDGLWLFGEPKIVLPDPENYGFHEGGPTGWEFDEEHGIATCPYIVPGQREIQRLDSLPASASEAMRLFRGWRPPSDSPRAGRGWDDPEVIENCLLHDRQGQPQVVIRETPWAGNSVTFPVNANPWLFDGSGRRTVGRMLVDYSATRHRQIPALDGMYIDSLGMWGDYDNFRQEHFAYARLPLSYDASSGRPMIPNHLSLLEFLQGLGEVLHPDGKLVFGNGIHPTRRFQALAVDVLGVEGRGQLEHKRTIAGSKPFLLLIYNIHTRPAEMEQWFNRCAHWGIYPSFGNITLFRTPESYAPIAQLNNRYVPSMREVTEAGWQPVTHVRASGGALVERWGPGSNGATYLTVFSARATTTTLTLDTAALGLGTRFVARDLLTGDQFSARAAAGGATLSVRLSAGRVRMLRLR